MAFSTDDPVIEPFSKDDELVESSPKPLTESIPLDPYQKAKIDMADIGPFGPATRPEAVEEAAQVMRAIPSAMGAGAQAIGDVALRAANIPTDIANVVRRSQGRDEILLLEDLPRPQIPSVSPERMDELAAQTAPRGMTPAAVIPPAGITAAINTAAQAIGGMVPVIAPPEVGLTLPLAGVGGKVGRVVAGLYGASAAGGLPEQIGSLAEPSTDVERGQKLANIAVQAGMAGMMLHQAGKATPKVEQVLPRTAAALKGETHAVEKGIEQEGVQPERPGDGKGGTPAETGGGGGLQPAAPVEEKAQVPLTEKPPVVRDVPAGSVRPEELAPAVRLNDGTVIRGKPGDSHADIIQENQIQATDIDQRGFADSTGKFLDREAAAKGTGIETAKEPGRLHTSDLPEFDFGPLEREAIDAGESAGTKVNFVDEAPEKGGEPFMAGDLMKATARGIVVDRKAFQNWISRFPEGQRKAAIQNAINHERIHQHVSNTDALWYWNLLTPAERVIRHRNYTGYWSPTGFAKAMGRSPFTPTQLGHEALRYRIQQASGMTPSEFIRASIRRSSIRPPGTSCRSVLPVSPSRRPRTSPEPRRRVSMRSLGSRTSCTRRRMAGTGDSLRR